MTELAERVIAHRRASCSATAASSCASANPEAVYLVDNPNRRCPNIDKAREHLGYDPRIGIEEGVQACPHLVLPQPVADEA